MSQSPDPHASTPTFRREATQTPPRGAVVLLHGRGASAESMLGFVSAVGLEDLTYVAPEATSHTWYPESFLAPLARNGAWLESALRRIQSTLDGLLDEGFTYGQIALLGFSQGACLSLEFTAREGHPLGAVLALSGGLIGNGELLGVDPPADKTFDYAADLSATPVFLGCSDVDFHIPLDRVERSAEVMATLGADVTKRIYPGMGHTVNQDELTVVREMLRRL